MRRLLAPLLLFAACRGEPATAADCREILDRIVALELAEQGYRDPALTQRKQEAFAQRYAAEMTRCEGVRLPAGARECVARAGSSEQISHECLR
ncbi:MAG: hypothetical protein IPO88_09340 [Nannocystis sp.]|uniref:hypothetical protein n=1 Tax=Nannocystis sp. TaxID=1962667 RepID=UPI002427FDDA|nr:hypothetical protein [Nannocystis sp.]MBK9753693.1 hypothetical protein [Nannocystis sp.]